MIKPEGDGLRRLSELEPGKEAVIIALKGGGPLLRRLADMGFTVGARVRVLRKAPLGDPIEFEVKGYNVSLRREEAEGVLVEVCGEGGEGD